MDSIITFVFSVFHWHIIFLDFYKHLRPGEGASVAMWFEGKLKL